MAKRRFSSFLILPLLAHVSCLSPPEERKGQGIPVPDSYGPTSYPHCFAYGNHIHLLGGYHANEQLSTFNSGGITYSLATKTWKSWTVAEGPNPKNYFAGAIVKDDIYVFGGKEPRAIDTRDLFVYHSDKDRWERLPVSDRLKPRSSASLIAIDPWLIVFGGRSSEHKNNWGVLNLETRSWKVYANNTAERSSHIAVRLGSKAMIWGGFEDQKRSKEGFLLDPANGDVKPLPPIPFLNARANAKAVSEGEKAWIIGGVSDQGPQTDGAYYDHAYKAWAYIPALPDTNRKDFEITMLKDKGILLWGGRTIQGDAVTKAYLLELDHRRWKEVVLPSTPSPRIAHCMGSTEEDLYIFGGLTNIPGQGQRLSGELWLMPIDAME